MTRKIIILFLTLFFGLIAVLPLSLLKYISRILYIFIYRIFNYRRDVINFNLIYALPYVKDEQFTYIEGAFYRHLSELIIEIIKGLFIPIDLLLKRIHLTEESALLIQRLTQEKRHVVLMLGHYGNWEWPLLIIQKYTTLKPFALYAPLSFKAMDGFLKERRERFGATMLDATKARNLISTLTAQPSVIAIVGDQSPTGRTRVHETRFLSIDTKFFNGAEKIAQKLNAAVVYVHMEKTAFAQYTVHLEILAKEAETVQEGMITEAYVRKLETKIQEKPEFWMWSHKRWKGTIPY